MYRNIYLEFSNEAHLLSEFDVSVSESVANSNWPSKLFKQSNKKTHLIISVFQIRSEPSELLGFLN